MTGTGGHSSSFCHFSRHTVGEPEIDIDTDAETNADSQSNKVGGRTSMSRATAISDGQVYPAPSKESSELSVMYIKRYSESTGKDIHCQENQ